MADTGANWNESNPGRFGSTADERKNENFRRIDFTGTASEYWGIWISNLLLSIITLGIYSAWAKVRRKTYFLNNTQIDGFPLIYHATGVQIFKGRILAFLFIVIYSVLSALYIPAGAIFSVIILFLFPWALNRSLRFNARVTSWRNVHLNWYGTYWKTFALMWLAMPAMFVSLGLLVPAVSRWAGQYYVRRHTFGTTFFQENMKLGPFVKAYLLVATIPVVLIVSLVIAFFNIPDYMFLAEPEMLEFFAILGGIGVIFIIFVAYTVYRTITRNIIVGSMALGSAVNFKSDLKPGRVVWIIVSNIIVIILTLGLAKPWADIRIFRYQAEHTSYAFAISADEFIDEEQSKMSAFGEEFAEFEDLDFSL